MLLIQSVPWAHNLLAAGAILLTESRVNANEMHVHETVCWYNVAYVARVCVNNAASSIMQLLA